MEKHIATYLFQNKQCPLPGIGSLEVHDGNAFVSYAEKKIIAPRASIHFSERESSPEAFQEYIAGMENLPAWSAKNLLTDFCRKLQNLDPSAEIAVPETGVFYKNNSGKIGFHAIELSPAFFPDIDAEKVIHPNAEHNMLVGDKETSNVQMTEYFSVEEEVESKRRWLWPIILTLLAIALIIAYYLQPSARNHGNMQPIHANESQKLYQQK